MKVGSMKKERTGAANVFYFRDPGQSPKKAFCRWLVGRRAPSDGYRPRRSTTKNKMGSLTGMICFKYYFRRINSNMKALAQVGIAPKSLHFLVVKDDVLL